MLFSLIPIFMIILCALSLSLLLKKHFADLVAPVFFSVILVLYGFYVNHHLFLGRKVVLGLFLILYAVTAVQMLRHRISKTDLKQLLFTPALALYLAAVAVFLLFSANKYVNLMDCLRLWGAYPKILHSTGKLQLGEDSFLYSYMQSYPPGMPLLCYFISSFGKVFSEKTLFLTYSLFGFSLILPFFRNFRWQNKKSLLVAFLASIIIPWMITSMNTDDGFYYSSLFIDMPLGICCGYVLYHSFHRTGKSGFDSICMILSCGILSLLKDSGAFLAVCGILGALVCGYLRRKEVPFFRTILTCAGALVLLVGVFGLWRYLMAQHNVINDGQFGLAGLNLVTLARILFHFFRTPVTGFYSFTGAVVVSLPGALLTVFVIKMLLTAHNPQETIAVEWTDILFQAIAYAIFFVGYSASFMQDILRQDYPSYVRYFCTLVTSSLYILAADCFFRHNNLIRNIYSEISTFLQQDYTVCKIIRTADLIIRYVMLGAVVFAFVVIMFDFPSKQQSLNFQAEASVEALEEAIPVSSADVYLCIPSNDDAYARRHHLIYFDLLDSSIRIKNYFSVAKITDPELGYTPDSFLELLQAQDYDYVMLTYMDEALLAQFGDLFPGAAPEECNLIYQVTDSGLIRIR